MSVPLQARDSQRPSAGLLAASTAVVSVCAGNPDAALMLASAMAAESREFTRAQSEWQAITGLNRWKQEAARATLRDLGFWHEETRGLPARLHYRIDVLKILETIGGSRTNG